MYEAKNFDHLLGTAGFSDQLLKNHFTLYQGYVTNTNKLLTELEALRGADGLPTPQFSELKRRFGWEWSGMRLHELYFGNMNKEKSEPSEALKKEVAAAFGSWESWEKDFRATGAMRGIGWVILYRDSVNGKLINTWINEHDLGHLPGATPVLIMDVFEHAFMIDYGLKRADYITAFWNAIDWTVVAKRLNA